MVYTLNAVGPLRGLPVLSVGLGELTEQGDLSRVDKAIETFAMGPGKRLIAVKLDDLEGHDRALTAGMLRGLKTRGFTVYGIGDGRRLPPESGYIDAYIAKVKDKWLNFAVSAIVIEQEGSEPIEEPEIIVDLSAVPKFLVVEKMNKEVVRFLRESRHLWAVQLPSVILEVDL